MLTDAELAALDRRAEGAGRAEFGAFVQSASVRQNPPSSVSTAVLLPYPAAAFTPASASHLRPAGSASPPSSRTRVLRTRTPHASADP
jgi:hypothetical protein